MSSGTYKGIMPNNALTKETLLSMHPAQVRFKLEMNGQRCKNLSDIARKLGIPTQHVSVVVNHSNKVLSAIAEELLAVELN
jgi:hypothetical protein